jgi:hypothetical protein
VRPDVLARAERVAADDQTYRIPLRLLGQDQPLAGLGADAVRLPLHALAAYGPVMRAIFSACRSLLPAVDLYHSENDAPFCLPWRLPSDERRPQAFERLRTSDVR